MHTEQAPATCIDCRKAQAQRDAIVRLGAVRAGPSCSRAATAESRYDSVHAA